MSYGYRLCLSSVPSNQIPFGAPAGYDPAEFEILARRFASPTPPTALSDMFLLNTLQNNKFDLNNGGSFILATDEVGESVAYPNGSVAQRQQIEAEYTRYTQALLYYLTNDPTVPQSIQASVQGLGLCKDEFTDNGGWPHQIYVREARRMIGQYVLTTNDLEGLTSIPDSIGMGGYKIDSHPVNVTNNNGNISYEPAYGGEQNVNPYPIPYRILTPQASQATNLLVSVDASASHLAYDSLRIEITYMIMGQATGAAASLAITQGTTVQNVPVPALQAQLVNDGAILALPPAYLSATSLWFGNQAVGTASGSQSIILTNYSSAPLNISNIGLAGANPLSFVFANSCGSSLAAGANCTIHGHFAPTSTGLLTATVTIADNAPNSPQVIPIGGMGIATPPTVSLSATNLSFGTESIGLSTVSQTVTLTNTGGTTLNISSINISGAGAPSFVMANSCGLTVAAGANCTIHGHFAPTAVGTQSATITITDNAGNSPESISLSGIGTASSALTVSPSSLSFGGQDFGYFSNIQTVTLTNTGSQSVNLASIGLTGAYATSYLASNNCGAVLAVGASCSIHVRFNPQFGITPAIASVPASLSIVDDAPSSPQIVILTGTPLAITPTITWAAPASIGYGTALGATQLNATANVAGTFSYTPSLGAVLPAGTQTISVTFTPH